MQKYNWNYPTTMWVGENRINDIAVACKSLEYYKPLLSNRQRFSRNRYCKKHFINIEKINYLPNYIQM